MSRAQGGIIYLSQNDWEDMRYVWKRVIARLPQIRDMANITPNMSDFATLNVVRNFRDHPPRVKGLIGRVYWGYLQLQEPQKPLEPLEATLEPENSPPWDLIADEAITTITEDMQTRSEYVSSVVGGYVRVAFIYKEVMYVIDSQYQERLSEAFPNVPQKAFINREATR